MISYPDGRPVWVPETTLDILDRAVAARDAIVGMYDERFYRMWIFYLSGAAAAFEFGGMCNYQLQFARRRTGVPVTRDYLGEAELRLR